MMAARKTTLAPTTITPPSIGDAYLDSLFAQVAAGVKTKGAQHAIGRLHAALQEYVRQTMGRAEARLLANADEALREENARLQAENDTFQDRLDEGLAALREERDEIAEDRDDLKRELKKADEETEELKKRLEADDAHTKLIVEAAQTGGELGALVLRALGAEDLDESVDLFRIRRLAEDAVRDAFDAEHPRAEKPKKTPRTR